MIPLAQTYDLQKLDLLHIDDTFFINFNMVLLYVSF